MVLRCIATILLVLSPISMLLAHEVRHLIEPANAVTVHLSYTDGTPFAFEAFEVYPEGKDIPQQTGRTDAQGRAIFLPGNSPRWRIKAFSADGHGVDIHVTTPSMTIHGTKSTAEDGEISQDPNRASLLLFGLSALLAAFGAYQLWLRKP